jgi:hemin uptake protein HemP
LSTYAVNNRNSPSPHRDAFGRAYARKTFPLSRGQDDREGGQPPPPQKVGQPRRLKVSDLLGEERELILEHRGQDYRLRVTASGKLILTK